MSPVAASCPDVSTLERFTLGQMTPDEVERLAGHCEGCESCIRRMQALGARDTLLEALSSATVVNRSGGSTVDRLIARLRALLPPAAQDATCASDAGATPSPASDPSRELCDFLAPSQQPDELGRLGPYRVLEVLGAGGMGVVFRADDPQLRREIALKAMLPALAASASARQRFLREAQAAAAIKHDHIVTIHQVGEDRGAPFLAMEFLEGEPLEDRLQRAGKLPVPEALRIGREMAEGLAAAHERGLIHRDIKPANVWLESRGERGGSTPRFRVKILDFGLARAANAESHLTQQGAIVGTPAYMAPEQATGQPVDARCDLFSLGCVLYRMLTGQSPFRGPDALSTLLAVTSQTPRPPREVDPAIPRALSDLVVRLLAKNPAERPASAHEVADTLAALAADRNAPAADHTHVAAPPAPPRRRRRLALALLGAAALLVAGAVIYVQTDRGTLEIRTHDKSVKVAIEQDGTQIDILDPQSKQQLSIRSGKYTLKLIGEADGLELATDQGTNPVTLRRGGKVIVEVRPVPKPPVAGPQQFTNGLGMEFVLVPKGRSWLGGGAGKPGEQEVEVLHDFYLGKYEVTQEEWEKVLGKNPSHFSRTGGGKDAVKGIGEAELKRFPVEMVSWEDAQLFLRLVNEGDRKDGWVYRLPKEVEWEYACRGGPGDRFNSAFDYYFENPTNHLLPAQANFEHGKGLKMPCKVGTYPPNRLGLCDLHGNVQEWCDDETKDDKGASLRVLRGGTYLDGASSVRAAARNPRSPEIRVGNFGLRLARVPVGKEIVKLIAPVAKQPSFPPLDEAWVKKVQALPVEKMGDAVGAELKRRNPGFDGKVTLTADERGKITLSFLTNAVTDISPVRALPNLVNLECYGSGRGKGILVDVSPLRGLPLTRLQCGNNRVNDLSPLKGMALTVLYCNATEVSDLSPLKGMPLAELQCGGTKVEDLSPLQGMRLMELFCNQTRVKDLSPLKGMPLHWLYCEDTSVTDLAPLKGMPLKSLRVDFKPERDAEILRSIKTLETINDQPAAEFWKKVDAGKKP
jgi:formylglycine-generating enzyme required for sulfatase activity